MQFCEMVMSHRQFHAICEKLYMPPLIEKIRHDTFVELDNYGHFIWKKLSQLEHIKIWKKNQSIFTEIQSIFQKYAPNVIISIQMRHEIIFTTHNLSNMKKYWEFLSILKSYNRILYRHVFAHVLLDKDNAGPRTLSTLTDAHCVIKRWTSYQNALKNVPNMKTEKIRRFYVAKC